MGSFEKLNQVIFDNFAKKGRQHFDSPGLFILDNCFKNHTKKSQTNNLSLEDDISFAAKL